MSDQDTETNVQRKDGVIVGFELHHRDRRQTGEYAPTEFACTLDCQVPEGYSFPKAWAKANAQAQMAVDEAWKDWYRRQSEQAEKEARKAHGDD